MSRMEVIDMMRKCIESYKKKIVLINSAQRASFQSRQRRIANLQIAIAQCQRVLLELLEQELDESRKAG